MMGPFMQYKVELKPKATKFLKTISNDDREKIEKRLIELSKNPRNDQVIKMAGRVDQYRVRQGDYRILFTICDDKLIVVVIDIKNRKDIYKK